MSLKFNRAWVGMAVVAIASATALGVGAVGASAATVQSVRPTDIITVPGLTQGTSGSSQAMFLKEGIRIENPDPNDYAIAYYATGGIPLADVHTVQYEWFGTPNGQPGLEYNIDIDGDNKADAQLTGEKVYGGKEVWLNKDAGDFKNITPTVAADFFSTHAPCINNVAQPANGNQDGNCGSGYPAEGTLDDWARAIAKAGKTAKVISAGYLANGLVESGVLRSHTIGATQFVFTNEAAPTADPDLAACNGVAATIAGSNNAETLVGTAGNDVIAAGAGDDTVYGLGGNDIICGGDGNDKLKGGKGKDQIFGNDGSDRIGGGKGRDRCDGGAGVDKAKCEKRRDL